MTDDTKTSRLQAEIISLIPALRAFARRFHRSPNDADDLVQETLVKALANLDRFREGTHLKSWLFTIMRNAFCSSFGIARRETPGLTECVSDRREIPPPQHWRLMAREVSEAYEAMPSYYREVIAAVVIAGRSYEEAAREFDCTVGTVKSRLSRARTHLVNQCGDLND